MASVSLSLGLSLDALAVVVTVAVVFGALGPSDWGTPVAAFSAYVAAGVSDAEGLEGDLLVDGGLEGRLRVRVVGDIVNEEGDGTPRKGFRGVQQPPERLQTGPRRCSLSTLACIERCIAESVLMVWSGVLAGGFQTQKENVANAKRGKRIDSDQIGA